MHNAITATKHVSIIVVTDGELSGIHDYSDSDTCSLTNAWYINDSFRNACTDDM